MGKSFFWVPEECQEMFDLSQLHYSTVSFQSLLHSLLVGKTILNNLEICSKNSTKVSKIILVSGWQDGSIEIKN